MPNLAERAAAPVSRQPEPLAYTVPDAMAVTGLGRTSIYRLISENRLRSVTIGRRRLITAESVRALLSAEAA